MADVDSLNRDFSKYDQVTKTHTYRLAESEADEFDEDYRDPILDFEPFLNGDAKDKSRFAEEFAGALEEIGFAVLVGHGVDPALYDEMHDATAELFTSTSALREDALPRRSSRIGQPGLFPDRGDERHSPRPGRGLGLVQARLRHSAGRDAPFRPEDYWPDVGYERQLRPLVLAHEALFKPIAQSMLQELGCEPHLLDGKLTGTNFGLRLNYYPPMSAEQDHSGAGRLLGHEDVDLFTILPASRTDGLQVWNHRSGKWVRMKAPPGSIIINTGDYMQRLSNDRLPSTTHRVGKPDDGSHLSGARISFPMAVYLWEDELLQVLPGLGAPKYEPIKAIAFHTRSTSKFYGDDYAVESAQGPNP